MVMRQRTGATTTGRPATGRLRPVLSQNYQYLTPTFEWKQEEGRAVLVVHLPGFTKEQLGVQLQSMDKLRVRGTRQARGNTYIRFDQTYPIPEDCTTTGLQAKFEAGLLYVMLEKKKKEEADDVTPSSSIPKQSEPTQLPPPKKPMEEAIDSTAPPPKPSSSVSPGDGKPVEAPSKVMESQESVSHTAEAKKTAEAPPTEAGLKKEKDPRITTDEALIRNKQEEAEEPGLKKETDPRTTTEEALIRKKQEEAEKAGLKKEKDPRTTTEEALIRKKQEETEKAGLKKEKDPRTTTEEALIRKKQEEVEKAGLKKEKDPRTTTEEALIRKKQEEAKKVGEDTVEKATAGEEMGKMEKALLDQKQDELGEKKMSTESKAMNGSSDQIKKDKESNLTDEIKETDQKRLEKGEKTDESGANITERKGTEIGSTEKNGVVDKGYDQFGKYKQLVKNFITPKDEEERKLLVNIGVAALVIVALGAYITYSRWSTAKRQ